MIRRNFLAMLAGVPLVTTDSGHDRGETGTAMVWDNRRPCEHEWPDAPSDYFVQRRHVKRVTMGFTECTGIPGEKFAVKCKDLTREQSTFELVPVDICRKCRVLRLHEDEGGK